jgi:hypothetical protein
MLRVILRIGYANYGEDFQNKSDGMAEKGRRL